LWERFHKWLEAVIRGLESPQNAFMKQAVRAECFFER